MDLNLGGLSCPLLHLPALRLKWKQDLERQEAGLKAKREELEIETAIGASDAKLKVLDDFATGCMSPGNPIHESGVEIGGLASGARHEQLSHVGDYPFWPPNYNQVTLIMQGNQVEILLGMMTLWRHYAVLCSNKPTLQS